MKKLIVIGLTALALSASAVVYTEQEFLNGWNLFVTNGATSTVGTSNYFYTDIHGAIWQSLESTGMASSLATNGAIAPDVFGPIVKISPDANGDFVANAAIHYLINYTNWIPIAITNSAGQYFVTNTWPLIPAGLYPQYMYPVTTNVYPALPVTQTLITTTISIQHGWDVGIPGFPINVWDTSAADMFTFSVNANPSLNITGVTNLPTSWLQSGMIARLYSVGNSAVGTNALATGVLINQLSLGQPRP
jgi:hypothetical protein